MTGGGRAGCRRPTRLVAVAMMVTAMVLAGCASRDRAGALTELRVLAAASLTEAMPELAAAFEERRPPVEVVVSFGGSSSLARQVAEGAPADVLITADRHAMDQAAGAVRGAVVIARNRMVIAVPAGNPGAVSGAGDLEGATVVLCAEAAPCGRIGARILQRAGVQVVAASEEQSVKGVVAKLALGEADAGLVYETDVAAAADRLQAVPLPDQVATGEDVEAVYLAAIVEGSQRAAAAEGFIAFLTGAGAPILERFGFRPPSGSG